MKTAIVTGGGSGIGLAVARGLARERFRVGLIGRTEGALEAAASAVSESGGQAWWAAVDVRDPAAVEAFVHDAVGRFNTIDLLVNSAGVFELRPFAETTLEFWHDTLETNLTGAFLCTRAVWPHISGGQIINISSVAGLQAFEGCAAYSASKFGLVGFSEVLALEGRSHNIRVHVVCPGNTRTPIWQDQAPASVQAKMLRPEDVAEIVCWLAVSPPEVTFGRLVVLPAQDPWQ